MRVTSMFSHLPCHRNPAKPSLGLSSRQLPGPRGTLLKKGFPRCRLPQEEPPQLQDGFMETGERRVKEKTSENYEALYSTTFVHVSNDILNRMCSH